MSCQKNVFYFCIGLILFKSLEWHFNEGHNITQLLYMYKSSGITPSSIFASTCTTHVQSNFNVTYLWMTLPHYSFTKWLRNMFFIHQYLNFTLTLTCTILRKVCGEQITGNHQIYQKFWKINDLFCCKLLFNIYFVN